MPLAMPFSSGQNANVRLSLKIGIPFRMLIPQWLTFALLSAAFAALVSIFGKVGMKEIDSNLATSIRSVVMTAFLLGLCTVTGLWSKLETLHGKALTMIALSGVAGAVSWLFYFKAIQVGTVSQVAPIDKLSMPLAVLLAVLILGDSPSRVNWVGILLIAAGAYLASKPAHS
jgi:transporter family protein